MCKVGAAVNTTDQHAPTATGAQRPGDEWTGLAWATASTRVRNLRQRIFRATQEQARGTVRDLQRLLLRRYANLALSVRPITPVNDGRKTPGVDGETARTAAERGTLLRALRQARTSTATPTRRVSIPQANGKQRPLGSPTLRDRVRQHVVKTALEPSWEARFEPTSDGFRPGRSVHDAVKPLGWFLRQQPRSPVRHGWVLDADIRAACDRSSHEHILARIGGFPARDEIRAWLKAGYLALGTLHATDAGTPPGGVSSPLLANIALDGLHAVLRRYRLTESPDAHLGYARYADDDVVRAPTRAVLDQVTRTIGDWLAERGLECTDEKPRIVRVDAGVNFLGFHVRRDPNGKLLSKPHKEKVLTKRQEITRWLNANKHLPQDKVIQHLNPILWNWAAFSRHQNSTDPYSYVAWRVFRRLGEWALRRHPNKRKQWVKRRSFRRIGGRDWRFAAETELRRGKRRTVALVGVTKIAIVPHVRVPTGASTDDPSLRASWDRRQRQQGAIRSNADRGKLRVCARQVWTCHVGKERLFTGAPMDVHHLDRVTDGGADVRTNLEIRHEACHDNAHGRESRQPLSVPGGAVCGHEPHARFCGEGVAVRGPPYPPRTGCWS